LCLGWRSSKHRQGTSECTIASASDAAHPTDDRQCTGHTLANGGGATPVVARLLRLGEIASGNINVTDWRQ
jgi:hypothetical protein